MKALRLLGSILLGSLFAFNSVRAYGDEVGGGIPTVANNVPSAPVTQAVLGESAAYFAEERAERRFLESDHAFDNFIGPITNPVFSKDPRSLTEARALFIHNSIDPNSLLGPGNFQAYALQIRLALTERLTFIADKDGFATIRPNSGPHTSGFLNVGAGLKYVFLRDVENQTLGAAGFMYEIPSGQPGAYSNFGNGTFTFFLTGGKELSDQRTHVLGTVGYQVPVDSTANSSYYYTSLHIDRQYGKFYPLLECNWFHYVAAGNHGFPTGIGEGDGLLNLGTSGVVGNDLVTLAVGAKYRFTNCAELGAAWEFPVSNRHDLLNNRVTVDFILRY